MNKEAAEQGHEHGRKNVDAFNAGYTNRSD